MDKLKEFVANANDDLEGAISLCFMKKMEERRNARVPKAIEKHQAYERRWWVPGQEEGCGRPPVDGYWLKNPPSDYMLVCTSKPLSDDDYNGWARAIVASVLGEEDDPDLNAADAAIERKLSSGKARTHEQRRVDWVRRDKSLAIAEKLIRERLASSTV